MVFNSTGTFTGTATSLSASGLGSVTGVVSINTGTKTIYNIGTVKLNINGTLSFDSNSEMIVSSGNSPQRQLEINNGGNLTIDGRLIVNGETIDTYEYGIVFSSENLVACCANGHIKVNGGGTLNLYGASIRVGSVIEFKANSIINITNGKITCRRTFTSNQAVRIRQNSKLTVDGLITEGIALDISVNPLLLSNYEPRVVGRLHGVEYYSVNNGVLEDFAGVGNSVDADNFNNNQMFIKNSKTGTDLIITNSKGNASNGGTIISKKFKTKLIDDNGNIEGVKIYIKDTNNGNRRNQANIVGDETQDLIYIQETGSNGETPEFEVITGYSRGGHVLTSPNAGVIDLRGKTNIKGEDKFDVQLLSYKHDYKIVEVAMKGLGVLQLNDKMFFDLKVSETDKSVTEALSKIDTVQKLYDYDKYVWIKDYDGTSKSIDRQAIKAITTKNIVIDKDFTVEDFSTTKDYTNTDYVFYQGNVYRGKNQNILSGNFSLDVWTLKKGTKIYVIDGNTIYVKTDILIGDITTTGSVDVRPGSRVDGIIVDNTGDSTANVSLATAFNIWSIHNSEADAIAGSNSIFSGTATDNTFRFLAATYSGQTKYLRATGNGNGSLAIYPIVFPTEAGVVTFSELKFDEQSQLTDLQNKITTVNTHTAEIIEDTRLIEADTADIRHRINLSHSEIKYRFPDRSRTTLINAANKAANTSDETVGKWYNNAAGYNDATNEITYPTVNGSIGTTAEIEIFREAVHDLSYIEIKNARQTTDIRTTNPLIEILAQKPNGPKEVIGSERRGSEESGTFTYGEKGIIRVNWDSRRQGEFGRIDRVFVRFIGGYSGTTLPTYKIDDVKFVQHDVVAEVIPLPVSNVLQIEGNDATDELARLIAAGSSGGGGSAPTADQNAAAVRLNLATELSRIDANISSVPTANQNAAATRLNLATELARIDANVSDQKGLTTAEKAKLNNMDKGIADASLLKKYNKSTDL
jgi:hypothetical protein